MVGGGQHLDCMQSLRVAVVCAEVYECAADIDADVPGHESLLYRLANTLEDRDTADPRPIQRGLIRLPYGDDPEQACRKLSRIKASAMDNARSARVRSEIGKIRSGANGRALRP